MLIIGFIAGFCAGTIVITTWALCRANKDKEDEQ